MRQKSLINFDQISLEGFFHLIENPDAPLQTFQATHLSPMPSTTKNDQYLLLLVDVFSKLYIRTLFSNIIELATHLSLLEYLHGPLHSDLKSDKK